MTAQVREKLIYNDREYYLATEPLYPYLIDNKITFVFSTTSCWRGYIGSWLIEDNKLYITGLEAYVCNSRKLNTILRPDRKVGLDYLFPGQSKVFADWYSGEIRIPYGKMMKYVHQGYASLYEEELFLKVEAGIITSCCKIDNTHFYNDEEGMNKRNMSDLLEAIFGGKPRKRKS